MPSCGSRAASTLTPGFVNRETVAEAVSPAMLAMDLAALGVDRRDLGLAMREKAPLEHRDRRRLAQFKQQVDTQPAACWTTASDSLAAVARRRRASRAGGGCLGSIGEGGYLVGLIRAGTIHGGSDSDISRSRRSRPSSSALTAAPARELRLSFSRIRST